VVGVSGVLVLPRDPVTAKPLPVPEPIKAGVIVWAHGGDRTWNANVREAVQRAKLEYPVEVVFGMAMHDVSPYQEAVDRLEKKGVDKIIVVPLLISSHSEVYRQYQYVYGLLDHPAFPEWHIPQAKVKTPMVFTKALDQDPVVVDILLDRLKAISREAAREVVVMVGHGPHDENDDAAWRSHMQAIAQLVRQQGHFHEVKVVTLREDAEPAIKAKATVELRYTVADWNRDYDVLVVPLLMSEGGIERGIPERLKGLVFRFKPQGLLPHPKISEWIRAVVRQTVSSF